MTGVQTCALPIFSVSDNTWLWPDVPGTPALTAGDWPVMESDTPTLKRVKRRTFTLIDNRNRQGWITRRFQCFPLAPLPESLSHRVPDILYPPKTEKKECKDNLPPPLYSFKGMLLLLSLLLFVSVCILDKLLFCKVHIFHSNIFYL